MSRQTRRSELKRQCSFSPRAQQSKIDVDSLNSSPALRTSTPHGATPARGVLAPSSLYATSLKASPLNNRSHYPAIHSQSRSIGTGG